MNEIAREGAGAHSGNYSHHADGLGTRLRVLALTAAGILGATAASEALGANGNSDGYRPEPPVPTLVESAQHALAPIKIDSTKEMVQKWDADRRFFVEGAPPLTQADIQTITKVLSDHRDWTVLVAKDTYNEQYTSGDGVTHYGYDAMLYRLGQTLGTSTQFHDLVSPRTGRESGAMMVVDLSDSGVHGDVGYYASDGRKHVDLGPAQWKAGLNEVALKHLRGGAPDIGGAVQDTITEIDRTFVARESSMYINDNTKMIIGLSIGGAALLGGIIWLARKVDFGSGSSSSGGSSFFFFDSSSSGGGGGFDFGGGGGGDSGFGSSGF